MHIIVWLTNISQKFNNLKIGQLNLEHKYVTRNMAKNQNPNILSCCESDLMYIEVQIKRHIMYIVKV